eukprot:gnl/TRDRNA2_/TRDRNA2_183769_c0_seq1.p1 gnl/TRDRNA2_/TRDRNA2_183769_c0~~gnl/TRDRNA2_/TRDRNA2_183769_c0_seq1.p1  ORF type:complete len:255 (+),score=50.21 gnl/TRDRNA2_/TRDRNA2_183769_c0_seq1:244-1008(+)
MVKFINKIFDFFFDQVGFGAHNNQCYFQLFICFLNLMFSVYPIIMYFTLADDIHIAFWLGPIPQYVNLLVPVVLLFLNIGVNFFSCVTLSPKSAKVSCFMLFLILGGVLMGAGGYVHMQTGGVAGDLIDECGTTPMTAKMEAEWAKVTKFYERCMAMLGRQPDFIQQCPGFSMAFPNRVLIDYMEEVELDFACAGFCQFWARPLFNMDADRGLRCSTALGNHVTAQGSAVAVPTMGIGLGIVGLGVCLAGYDNL